MLGIWTKLAILGALLVALSAATWKVYHTIDKGGYNRAMGEWNAATALANETARETERLNQKSKEKALEERTKEILANVAAADGARLASERLRDSSERSLQSARGDHAACLVSASAHAELFGLCQIEYREMAKIADGHVTDEKAMISSWPK